MSFFSIKRIAYPLVVPVIFIGLSALVIWKWPLVAGKISQVKSLQALVELLPLLPYGVFSVGLIMGWRYGNEAMTLTSLALGLSYFALLRFPPGHSPGSFPGPSVPEATSFLLPLNLAFFALLTKRRVLTAKGVLCIILVVSEVLLVSMVCYPVDSDHAWLVHKLRATAPVAAERFAALFAVIGSAARHGSGMPFDSLSTAGLSAFFLAAVFLLVRYLYTQDVMKGGFLGALAATFLAFTAKDPEPALTLYFFAAGMILIVASVESSFSLAYTDELTGLPGRRSLNQTLTNLGKAYAIGMVDVDHFKRFNDRYGHKTGDQVLKMVAAKLQAVAGGGRSFRYGGEEFSVIFSGKTLAEAVTHLEAYRKAIASTPFVVRGKGRRTGSARHRGKSGAPVQKKAKITVSIGVAAPGKKLTRPDQVLKAADKKLYEAKNSGRNRVAS